LIASYLIFETGFISYTKHSQTIKIDIGNQLMQSISILDCYQLILTIDNNQTHRKIFSFMIAIDWQKSIAIDNSCLGILIEKKTPE